MKKIILLVTLAVAGIEATHGGQPHPIEAEERVHRAGQKQKRSR